MIKDIEKVKNLEYNLSILNVNIFFISESESPYGHVKEFNKLKNNDKYEAHRVISKVALELYTKGKIYGISIDVNGNRYDFDIFSDCSYRIYEVQKYKEISEVIANETNFNKNS